MSRHTRPLLVLLVLAAAAFTAACGGSSEAGSDPTTTADAGTTTTAADDGATTTADDGGSDSFGIGIATLTLDGNDHRIEFGGDDGTCETDPDAGTAKVSVSKDGLTFDLDYDEADKADATVKFTGEGLDVNGGSGASTPALTDVVVADGEVTGKGTFDSPAEGPDKTYLGEFKVLCP